MVVDSYQKKDTNIFINSVPNHQSILEWLQTHKEIISQKNIEKKFGIFKKEEKILLRQKLRFIEREGKIIYTYNRCYAVTKHLKIVSGKVIGHRDGYGFLRTDHFKDDLWLSKDQMKLCIHGDTILAYLVHSQRKGKSAARMLKILKPNNALIVGRYYSNKKIKFVIPDDTRFNFKIFILSSFNKKILSGSIVSVKLNKTSVKRKKIKGLIVEILGKKMTTNLSIDIALRTHSIPYVWSQEVKNEVYQIKKNIDFKDFKHRIDLRHLPFITIDNEDAKDFDDAVFCQKKKFPEDGWDLFIAISDVSYYVLPNTALDKAALERGTSIYFPSLVIPMLPEKISIDLCSLNPYQDRLCLICEISLSTTGQVTRYKHYEAIICSHGRFTYDEIFKIWNDNAVLQHKYINLLKEIKNLFFFQKFLKKHNTLKNIIYFENIEPQFVLDSNLRIKKIIENTRNDVHKLIESCMILANSVSASFLEKNSYPVLFRNHLSPTTENVVNFRLFLKDLGLSLSGGENPDSAHYSVFLKNIAHRPDYEMIQTVLLRSMKQAVYSPQNYGHFGLSLSSYVHFTSPIRRYPDLFVHRVIKFLILKNKNLSMNKKNFYNSSIYEKSITQKIGIHCSMTERRADKASRDVIDWLKCDFMHEKIGCIFQGVISNVTSFGLFVRLNQFFIDGLVHIASLNDDYYYFDTIRLKLIGKSGKNIFCLGDVLKVKVLSVNLTERKIELKLHKKT